HHARRARLADPAWGLQVLHQHDVDPRRLVDTQHAVVAEVRLFDTAVLDRDLAVKGGRQAEDDAALHLRTNRVGIDLDAAGDRAPNAGGIHRAILVDADLHDLRHKAAETDAERDAAPLPRRQRLAPSGSFRRDLHDVRRTRVLAEQRQAICE